MLTIPTADLVGLLTDTTPFAHPEADLPGINSVHLHWDGEMLHAMATDRFRIAISTWHPDDEPDEEVTQDDLFTTYGGADEPWKATVALDDATHLAKTFKLGAKQGRTPLTVDLIGGNVKVARSRNTGHSDIAVTVDGVGEPFPDLREVLADASTIKPIKAVAYSARYLADFNKVRPRGPLEFDFTGSNRLSLVRIGKRFVGAIMPTQVSSGLELVA